MSASLSRKIVLEVPGHALEVGSVGCGRGHRGRVLGCFPGTPGKVPRSGGGGAGAVGAVPVRWGRGGAVPLCGQAGKRRALRSPWPLRC